MLTNNITSAWRAAYNLYGEVWCHGLKNNQTNTAKINFVPYNDDKLDSESQTSEDEDSLEAVDSEVDDDNTDGSRSLGSRDSNSSWKSAISAEHRHRFILRQVLD